jgi:8-oxo-dGTP pyrophosphatase MutT (NUDIX family)
VNRKSPVYYRAFLFLTSAINNKKRGATLSDTSSDTPAVNVRSAATVLIMRQANAGMEILMLRRNAKLVFAGGAWVFPGGAVDQADSENAGLEHEEQAARVAAVRESAEECGLLLKPQQLVHFSHWTTPVNQKRRFATWFFAAVVAEEDSDVVIDDGEIHDFQWLTPAQAVAHHRAGDLKMMPPTYLSIKMLDQFASADLALESLRHFAAYWITPRISRDSETMVLLYPGDAGYEASDGALPGPRHRCVMDDRGVSYVHSGKDVGIAAMDNPQ